MTQYFVLVPAEEGLAIDVLTEQELKLRLKVDEDGQSYYGQYVKFLYEMPEEDWQHTMVNTILIIKGKIITPRPVRYATEYVIDTDDMEG